MKKLLAVSVVSCASLVLIAAVSSSRAEEGISGTPTKIDAVFNYYQCWNGQFRKRTKSEIISVKDDVTIEVSDVPHIIVRNKEDGTPMYMIASIGSGQYCEFGNGEPPERN